MLFGRISIGYRSDPTIGLINLGREKDRLDGEIKDYQENQHQQNDLLKKAKEEKDRLAGVIKTYQENQQDHLLKQAKEENDRLDELIKTYQENQHQQDDRLKEAMEEKDLIKLEENILFAFTKYLEKIKVLPAKT